jgi:hypothetical protein
VYTYYVYIAVEVRIRFSIHISLTWDQPRGLVVRVSYYWSWGPGFDSPVTFTTTQYDHLMLSHLIFYRMQMHRRQSLIDYLDFFRWARWKVYYNTRRGCKVGRYLDVLWYPLCSSRSEVLALGWASNGCRLQVRFCSRTVLSFMYSFFLVIL